ncbi:hypothetical protein II906_03740, partial [bacterium]|nr:hypothetical protein [bacterium]
EEQRSKTEEAKDTAFQEAKDAAGKILTQEGEAGSSVFGEMKEDLQKTGQAALDAAEAAFEDAASDVKAFVSDRGAEVAQVAKDAKGVVSTVAKAVGGFFKGIFQNGIKGAEEAVKE